MKRLLAALLLAIALPAAAVDPSGCASLCGRWQLDLSQSTAVAPAVDAALDSYADPRAKRLRKGKANDPVDQINMDMERSLGPIHDRPQRNDLRSELLTLLGAPAQLNLDARGSDIVIQGGELTRRLSPGTPRARVDAIGTAKISASWKSGRLTVTERYDRKRIYSETYAQRDDGTLLVTRDVKRPGLKPLHIVSVYRRS
jgi:hypothetical protein